MLSWIGLGSPTTVLVSLGKKEGPCEARAPLRLGPEHPRPGGRTSRCLSSKGLRWRSPAQSVADELAAAALEEHLDVLLSAKEREQGLHGAAPRGPWLTDCRTPGNCEAGRENLPQRFLFMGKKGNETKKTKLKPSVYFNVLHNDVDSII